MPKSKKIRVIIDTNLFVSFLIGKQLKNLKSLIVLNSIELIFSDQIIQELKLVGDRPKFDKYFTNANLKDLIELIYLIGQVYQLDNLASICRDPKDDFLLELADRSKADFLISGDKDVLAIKNYKKTKIITLTEFDKILRK